MDPAGFLADLEAKPQALRALAGDLLLEDPWSALPVDLKQDVDQVVLLGMGSSAYAGSTMAPRLRRAGVPAVCELASSTVLPLPHPRTLVVAISASGSSEETVDAVRRYAGVSPVVALVNVPESPLGGLADLTVSIAAGPEVGGVACRSYQHTVALLMALAAHAGSAPHGDRDVVASALHRAAEATSDLLDRRDSWLPQVVERLAGPDGTWVVAPAHRFSSAQQSALMLREGPRRASVACETGDWSHVDVYLTLTHDYRMLLFAGSPYEKQLLQWTQERKSTVVAVGAPVDGVDDHVRFRHDTDDDVRLLTEVFVAELVAQRLWASPAAPRWS